MRRSGEFSCFDRTAGNTAQQVRCAQSPREAGKGGPAPLQGAGVSVRKKTGFPSVNRLSGGGALHVWRAFVIAVAGSAHDGSRVASP